MDSFETVYETWNYKAVWPWIPQIPDPSKDLAGPSFPSLSDLQMELIDLNESRNFLHFLF
ncbi:MAG: hypothetical protein ACTSRA_02120 [Promethearchaeota archaeon]